MPDINRLGAGIELDGRLTLFLEGVGAGLLEAAKGRLQGQPGGGFVDLDHTGIDAVGELEGFLQIVGNANSMALPGQSRVRA